MDVYQKVFGLTSSNADPDAVDDIASGDEDTITGNGGNDTICGGAGGDTIDGGGDGDIQTSLAGNDTYIVGSSDTKIIEASDASGSTADRFAESVSYLLGAKTGVERITTTNASNITAINLVGNALKQSITGNTGVNTLGDGGGGGDTLSGLGGDDAYLVKDATTRVVEASDDSGGKADRIATTGSDTLGSAVNVERITTANANGIDAIDLTGNALVQTIIGNAGADTFVFSTTLDSIDRVTDFSVTDDGIDLARSVFRTLSTGALDDAAFKDLSLGAVDTSDRVLDDRASGKLFYNANASNSARVQFATFDNKAVLTSVDLFIV